MDAKILRYSCAGSQEVGVLAGKGEPLVSADGCCGGSDHRTKWLCITSASMLLPLALQHCWKLESWQSHFMSYWCTLTWGASVLYWHDAATGEPSWRLDVDRFFSRLSFLVVVVFAALFGRDEGSAMFGWLVGFAIVMLYIASCRMFESDNPNWIFLHGLMHVCVGGAMALCVWTGNRELITRQMMDTCGLHPLDAFFSTLGSRVVASGWPRWAT